MFFLFPELARSSLAWKETLPSTPASNIGRNPYWQDTHFPPSGRTSIKTNKLSGKHLNSRQSVNQRENQTFGCRIEKKMKSTSFSWTKGAMPQNEMSGKLRVVKKSISEKWTLHCVYWLWFLFSWMVSAGSELLSAVPSSTTERWTKIETVICSHFTCQIM